MHQTDFEITKGLHGLRTGFASLLSTRQTSHEKLATLKARLDEEWQIEMLPVINDLYWHPLRNGIDAAPEGDEELRTWLEEQYDEAAVIIILLWLLRRYQVRAYNLGGQIGLDMLNIDEQFRLTNGVIIADLDTFAESLVTPHTEYSLIDTTVNDLATEIPKARESESNTLLVLAAYIASRAAQRNEMIERTERPRQVGNALDQVYQRNGVSYKMYDVAGVGCPRICAPWHGTVFEVGQYARLIPQHPRCDCIWSPVRYDGEAVGIPPVTVSVPGLPAWEEPETIWTGQ